MKLQMALLLLWLLSCIPERSAKDLRGPGTVTGLAGRSLTIQCQYQEGWESSEKYWCRGEVWEYCTIIISTSKSGQERRSGRVSIRDNHQRRVFTVTINGLGKEDADIYWCGMKSVWLDPKHLVNVTISPGTMMTTHITQMTSGTHDSLTGFDLSRLEVLLPLVFAVLLAVLAGVSLLSWGMVWRQRKATGRSATTLKSQGLKPPDSALSHTDLLTHLEKPTTLTADPHGDKVTSALPSLLPSAHEEMEYVTMASFRRKDVPCAPGFTSDQALIYGNVGSLAHFAHHRHPTGETEYTLVGKG
ncbi:CMRF35-like molecule 1 [Tachyglossus aculeatus]|uniref:CMRF35-like molecule 1 n=1 Tax=Tachyglossus aculeatus TaxID=9261 RepID=UPI0018F6FF16|nr:CMRF35-like molecule 1 [Tachyglossus aculeatus]